MARFKKAPSHYPVIPSMIISFFRSGSASAVIVMMCYFIYHLKNDETHTWPVPYTFIILLAAGLVTFTFSIFKFFAVCFFGVSPLLSLLLNSIVLAAWTAGGASLGYFAGHTLINACDRDNWGQKGRGGQYVCHVYKGLFACTFLAWIFTVCAIILDIHVRRTITKKGKYQNIGRSDKKSLIHAHDDDPWSVELQPSPQPYGHVAPQPYGQVYPQTQFEPMGKPAAAGHQRTESQQPLQQQQPYYDTAYQGPGGHVQGEASVYYDPHGAAAAAHRPAEGP